MRILAKKLGTTSSQILRRGRRRLSLGLVSVASLILLVGCGASAPPQATVVPLPDNHVENTPATRSIVWGKADLEPTDAINKWQPTVDYLAEHLQAQGISSGAMKIAPDSETLGQWMAEGKVDIVVDSFYPAMIASEYSGAVPFAVRRTGKAPRHGVFFAKADLGLKSMDDLKGQTIAFAEPDSTSGFMLPMAYLRDQGYETNEQPTADSTTAAGKIGYTFAGDDDVVATWVLEGRVEAGAVDSPTFDDFNQENPGKLTVLAETEDISSDNIVLVRSDLEPEVAAALKNVLTSMDEDANGQVVLKGTKTARFDDYLQDASVDWENARQQYLLIRD